MPVYERTPQGQFAAYDVNSPLPRKLRSLLKVVDGKTEAEVYANSLESFGDVPRLLISLEVAGLIRPVLAANDAKTTNQAVPDEPSKSRKSNFMARLRGEKPDFAGSTEFFVPSTRMMAQPEGQPSTVVMSAETYPQGQSTTAASNSPERKAALALCVDEMSTFVLAHTPQYAFMILKELEEVGSLEQLAVTLGGYEQLIAAAGPVAGEHIGRIKTIIRGHW
jgi:hypothetical protein